MSDQTDEGNDYAQGSEKDAQTDAPSGKEATTESDETLPDDQATLQPESS